MVNEILFKQKLIELRMTQKELSEVTGIALSAINYMVKGKTSPNGKTIVKLCEVMQITDDAEKARIFLN